jgi:hypothetical protein
VTERPVRPTHRVRVTWFVVPAPGTVAIVRRRDRPNATWWADWCVPTPSETRDNTGRFRGTLIDRANRTNDSVTGTQDLGGRRFRGATVNWGPNDWDLFK